MVCGSKNVHQKGTYSKLILDSMVNITGVGVGRHVDHLMRKKKKTIFALRINEIFILAPGVTRKRLQPQFGFTNHLTRIACFISLEKWMKS